MFYEAEMECRACETTSMVEVHSVNRVVMWTCPTCGYDHREEVILGDDED